MWSLKHSFFCAILAGLFLVLPAAAVRSQQLGGSNAFKQNLDLPIDSPRIDPSDEEDPPEIIVLYGQSFEGDGFVFVGEPAT